MKKITASILTAAVLFFVTTAGAAAETRTSRINSELLKPEIHILYNDTMVKYEDVKPVNHADRIMIPFRAALESMGAQVDYNNDMRLVTAKKGNITIRFTLLDDTIYINNNGSESEMKMDVPMIIVQDRTMVPIRFISAALGMQVGWNGGTQTVVIMDYETCFDSFSKNIPNISKMYALKQKTFNKGQFSAKIGVVGEGMQLSLNIEGDSAQSDGVTCADGNVSIKKNTADTDKLSIKTVLKDNKIYLKTDSLKKLGAVSDSDAVNKALSEGKEWYSIDIGRVLEGMGFDSLTGMLQSAFASYENRDITDVMSSTMTKEGEASYAEAMNLASIMDFYELIDKRLEVSETDGGYTIKLEITSSDFANIICEMMNLSMTDELMEQLKAQLNCDLLADITCDGDKRTRSISLKTGGKTEFVFNDTSVYDASTTVDDVPQESYDITDIALGIFAYEK